MPEMDQYLEIGEHTGSGYSRVIEYEIWTVALMNNAEFLYTPEFIFIKSLSKDRLFRFLAT